MGTLKIFISGFFSEPRQDLIMKGAFAVNIDGYYFWHCDICGHLVAESPNESDPWGYGNLLLVNTGEWLTQVCRECVADMGDEIRGKGAGFILGGLLYTGPRARQWANEVIERLLDGGDIKEGACGWPVMAMCYG
ncbi:MAG: hypothetical protein ACPLQO_12805, partial [Desulfotomaculales bacterium]